MFTVIEKVIFLQSVEVFTEVSTEQLAYVAAIAEEITCMKGDDIFHAGDPSDAMYLVLDGTIKLHRDGRVITEAGAKEAFGTWALFDEEPRVASAIAMEDTRLLRIDREDFFDLLADNADITQGIFKTLVKRMRTLVGRVDSQPKNM